MKRGITVWNYAGDAVENTWQFHRMGFDAVSFLGRSFDALAPAEEERVAACIRETGMTFTIHHRLPNSEDPAACGAFLTGMEHIAAWQARYGLLTGLTFDFWHAHALLMPYLDAALGLLRGSGVTIACEDTPLDAAEYAFFEPLLKPGDRFGILVDAGHMNLRQTKRGARADEAFEMAIRALPVPLFEVHLSDNHGLTDEHATLGEGTLPLGAFTRGLNAIGFDGIATIERVPRGEPETLSHETAKRCMDAFMEAMATAK